ncbi:MULTISPECIES: Rv3235 family protein [Curtobacterium]|uniref:Rv3235 family protein n=1 Tax=Curtobacterium flaccumfaciens TaxID=2035 RepID=UPI003EE4ABCD
MEGAGVAQRAVQQESAEPEETGTRSAPPRLQAVPDAAEVPTPDRVTLTEADETARALALCVVEILSGAREVDSIARWITEDVHRHLQHRAALAARNRSATRRPLRRPVLRAERVVSCSPAAGVVEATVVVHGRSHARAVAIRLEVRKARWRATAVGVL